MIRLNNHWEFSEHWSQEFLEGKGEGIAVRIPHTVKELPLHYIDPEDYQMVCGYRRTLHIEKELYGKRLFLQFDGAAHIATVYVNGTEITTHSNGYTAFRAEITSLVKYGEDNLIAVKLDTTENDNIPPFGFVIDYLTFGGIYRDVWLDVRSNALVQDVFVETPAVNKAIVHVEFDRVSAGDRCEIVILDEAGTAVHNASCSAKNGPIPLTVDQVIPWKPGHGVLYTARVELKHDGTTIDTQEVKFGFRTVTVDETNIRINGESVFLRGMNRHQCFPYIGYAASESLQREDARILDEELAVNAVRTSHYPQSHYFLEECDKRGLLVFTEIPGWQFVSKKECWREQCVENVREMVKEYRNHPSIVLWGVRVNESMDDDELYRRTNAAAHELDPSRPTSGVRYIEKSSLLEDVYAYNDFSHNGPNLGAKPKKDVTPDMKKPLLISEANGHMYPTKPWDSWSHRQEHALRHARVMNQAGADGGHTGVFQWCMFDYPTHKDFGSGDRTCYHGVMDSFRNPKLAAAVYASQGEKTPVLELGNSMDIGDYPGGVVGDIYAFTNADSVELYKNNDFVKSFTSSGWNGMKHGPVKIDDTIGELLTTKEGFGNTQATQIRECMLAAGKYGFANLPARYKAELTWIMVRYHMSFEDGYNLYGKYVGNWGGEATVWRFDAKKNGKVIASVTKTPGQKLHLEVNVSNRILHEGDTYDMSAIRIRVLDENNNAAVYAQLPVTFQVEGPLELCGPATAVLEGGMGGTYLKTTGASGTATLRIHCEQTEDAVVEFEVK